MCDETARRRLARAIIAAGRRWLLVAMPLAGCVREPIAWGDTDYATTAARHDSDTTLQSVDSLTASVASGLPAACPGSVRVVHRTPTELHAVWWTARADSSAALMTARSTNVGLSWSAPTAIDSLDRGILGCRRPPPAIAGDARSGYVHVVYFLRAPEGAGVFFSHSMDGGALYHAPVPIVYGDRPSTASVAVQGDTVVVAYEDPNAARPEVSLALSRTSGHIFEHRFTASGTNAAARDPRVAVQGRTISIAWTDPASGRTAVRVGVLQ